MYICKYSFKGALASQVVRESNSVVLHPCSFLLRVPLLVRWFARASRSCSTLVHDGNTVNNTTFFRGAPACQVVREGLSTVPHPAVATTSIRDVNPLEFARQRLLFGIGLLVLMSIARETSRNLPTCRYACILGINRRVSQWPHHLLARPHDEPSGMAPTIGVNSHPNHCFGLVGLDVPVTVAGVFGYEGEP